MGKGQTKVAFLALLLLAAPLIAQPAEVPYGSSGIFFKSWCASGPFALPTCQGGGGAYGWGILAILATFAVFFALVVIYMLGYAFSLENVKRFAIAEFFEVVGSALLIIFITYLLWQAASGGIFTFISTSVIPSGSTIVCGDRVLPIGSGVGQIGLMDVAKCKVQDKITLLDKLYDQVYRSNMKVETWASSCFIIFGVQVYCGDFTVHGAVEQAHLIGEKIVPLQVNLHGQYALLEYINANMLGIFLPLGILLRVLPLTRGLGGLLIATALGFYFVFPIVFILTDPTFVRAAPSQIPPLTQGQACFTSFRGAVAVYNSYILPNMEGTQLSYGDKANLLVQLTVNIMFYPFVAFAVSLIFIRSLTPVLGGDMGDLMKMVQKMV